MYSKASNRGHSKSASGTFRGDPEFQCVSRAIQKVSGAFKRVSVAFHRCLGAFQSFTVTSAFQGVFMCFLVVFQRDSGDFMDCQVCSRSFRGFQSGFRVFLGLS